MKLSQTLIACLRLTIDETKSPCRKGQGLYAKQSKSCSKLYCFETLKTSRKFKLYCEKTRIQSSQILRGKIPVHQLPEGLDILRTGVAVVDVIGMFPYVASHQWFVRGCQRGPGVRRVDDIDGAVL